jgi:hypothetical protein
VSYWREIEEGGWEGGRERERDRERVEVEVGEIKK